VVGDDEFDGLPLPLPVLQSALGSYLKKGKRYEREV